MKFFGTNLTTKYNNIVHQKENCVVSSSVQKVKIIDNNKKSRGPVGFDFQLDFRF